MRLMGKLMENFTSIGGDDRTILETGCITLRVIKAYGKVVSGTEEGNYGGSANADIEKKCTNKMTKEKYLRYKEE